MKTFINKTFLAVVATVLVAGTAFFTSCEKEETSSSNKQNNTKSATASENIYLGSVENGVITYAFNVEELSEKLYEQGGIYIVEKFEILDSTLIDGLVEAYVVLYNVQEEVTESLWTPIIKDGNNYYMNAPEGSSGGNFGIRCKANKKCTTSCERKESGGVFLGCSCSDGVCREKELISAIIKSLVEAIKEIW